MPKRNKRILAIDPGTRETGYAILTSRYDLITWGVKTFRRNPSPRKLLDEAKRTIERLIDLDKPDVLVIEKPFFGGHWKSIPQLSVLADEFKALGKEKNLKVVELSPITVRKVLCGKGRATKRKLARTIIKEYFPALKRYYRYKQKFSKRHALGLTYIKLKERD